MEETLPVEEAPELTAEEAEVVEPTEEESEEEDEVK